MVAAAIPLADIKAEQLSPGLPSCASTPSSTTLTAPSSSNTPVCSTPSQTKLFNTPPQVATSQNTVKEKPAETIVKVEEKPTTVAPSAPTATAATVQEKTAAAAPVTSELPIVTSQPSIVAPVITEKPERKRVKQKARHRKHHKVWPVHGDVISVVLYFSYIIM